MSTDQSTAYPPYQREDFTGAGIPLAGEEALLPPDFMLDPVDWIPAGGVVKLASGAYRLGNAALRQKALSELSRSFAGKYHIPYNAARSGEQAGFDMFKRELVGEPQEAMRRGLIESSAQGYPHLPREVYQTLGEDMPLQTSVKKAMRAGKLHSALQHGNEIANREWITLDGAISGYDEFVDQVQKRLGRVVENRGSIFGQIKRNLSNDPYEDVYDAMRQATIPKNGAVQINPDDFFNASPIGSDVAAHYAGKDGPAVFTGSGALARTRKVFRDKIDPHDIDFNLQGSFEDLANTATPPGVNLTPKYPIQLRRDEMLHQFSATDANAADFFNASPIGSDVVDHYAGMVAPSVGVKPLNVDFFTPIEGRPLLNPGQYSPYTMPNGKTINMANAESVIDGKTRIRVEQDMLNSSPVAGYRRKDLSDILYGEPL